MTLDYHVGRAWVGTRIEDECLCEKAACGLVAVRHPDCEQHGMNKTIRQGHRAEDCPAAPKEADPR